jgi:hypothetical protein
VLGVILEVKCVDKGSHGVHAKDIAEYLAEFVNPEEGEIKTEKVDVIGGTGVKLRDQVKSGGR